MSENVKPKTELEDLSGVEDLVGDISHIIKKNNIDGIELASIIKDKLQGYLHIDKHRQQWNLKIREIHKQRVILNFYKKKLDADSWFLSDMGRYDLDFSGFEFSTVDFCNAHFPEDAFFVDAKFYSTAFFKGAEFYKGAYFDKATFFKGAEFFKTKFSKNIGYSEREFYGKATFREAIFRAEADFHQSEFYGGAIFEKTCFHLRANFQQNQFYEIAEFRKTNFYKQAIFEEVDFHEVANFYNVNFYKQAIFKKTKFSAKADFKNTKFEGKTDFQYVNAKYDVNFDSTDFQNFADFSYMKCKWVPNFRLCSFNKKISIHGFQFPEIPPEEQQKERKVSDFTDRYRALKLMAQEAGDQDIKLKAFAGEMRAKRYIETTGVVALITKCVVLIPNYLYGWFSNFGQSLWRPLLALVIVAFVLTLIVHNFFCIDWFKALFTSLNILFPFGNELIQANARESQSFLRVVFVGRILALPLLFLFGLAVRNRFLMK